MYFYFINGDVGVFKEKEIVSNISKLRNFFIIFFFDYIKEDEDFIWINIEWKYVWNLFKEDSCVWNIIIVNYD